MTHDENSLSFLSVQCQVKSYVKSTLESAPPDNKIGQFEIYLFCPVIVQLLEILPSYWLTKKVVNCLADHISNRISNCAIAPKILPFFIW